MNQPIIGITLDQENKKTYSNFPWYAARKNYAECVTLCSGVPIFLPHVESRIDNYLEIINGLIITGGDFDVDPNLYGEKDINPNVVLKPDRTNFELKITETAMKKKIPLLGICGGQQLLNVILGGSLFQHIPDEYKTNIAHEQENPRDQASHWVNIIKESKLFSITKKKKIYVNSAHHQSVKTVAKNVVINATAPDGIIEGIEFTELDFCLGVQWHPEFLIDDSDEKIFSSLIESAKKIEK